MQIDSPELNVTFLPLNRTVAVRPGDTLLDAALEHGLPLTHVCGGNCACTTCRVEVIAGEENLSPIEAVEAARLLTDAEATPHSRLACQAIVRGGPIIVRIVEGAV